MAAQSITGREREVLTRIALGESNKVIARALDLSVKTIEKHRSNLMRKLHLHNTAAITLYAVRNGLAGDARFAAPLDADSFGGLTAWLISRLRGGLVRLVGPDAPHDLRRSTAADHRRERELPAGHFRTLAQIADARPLEARRVPCLIGHADPVIAHLQAEHGALALEPDPDRFRLRVLGGIVEQFLHAAKDMR